MTVVNYLKGDMADMTEKRLTLDKLYRTLGSLRGYCSFDSEVIVRINEGREYIIIDDNGLEEIIKVKE